MFHMLCLIWDMSNYMLVATSATDPLSTIVWTMMLCHNKFLDQQGYIMTWTVRRATFNGIGVTSDCRCWLVTFTEYYRKREVSDVIRRFSCDDLFQLRWSVSVCSQGVPGAPWFCYAWCSTFSILWKTAQWSGKACYMNTKFIDPCPFRETKP